MARKEANFADPSEDDFADFVTLTSAQTAKLAFALTGDTNRAAELAERAYAVVRGRWSRLAQSGAEAELRAQLLHLAKRAEWQPAGLDVVQESGWPAVDVSADEVADRAERGRSRRGLFTAGIGVLAAGALGAGVWQAVRSLGSDEDSSGGALAPTYSGFVVAETRPVPMAQDTIHLDLLDPESGPRQYLAVRRGGLVLGTLQLAGLQLVSLVDPQSRFGRVLVAVSTPVEWMHLHGSWSDPLQPTMVSIGGHSVGVTPSTRDAEVDVLVAGGGDGHLFALPETRAGGLGFDAGRVWAYSVDGQLIVRRGQEVLRASSRARLRGVQLAYLADGTLVFVVWARLRPGLSVSGVGAQEVEIRQVRRFGWMGMRPPQTGPDYPTVTWTDWEGEPRSLELGEQR